jgi:hypothetical protein
MHIGGGILSPTLSPREPVACTISTSHPIWSDTRNFAPFQPMPDGTLHDEDVFTDNLALPNGKAKSGSGQIGKR